MARNRILAGVVFLIAAMIIVFPETAFQASLDGLKLWFEIVLPTLLPFFIMTDLLMGLGVVHFFGSLLEPIMRPLFRLPGVAGVALAMGVTAGYPLGAKVTGDLVLRQSLTKVEAERLVGFTNTAGPLFLIGAVGVGMFGSAKLGISLLIAHYAGAILVGFVMRFHKGAESPPTKIEGSYLERALKIMDKTRKLDQRSFGNLFADSVGNTFNSMLFICGCIMIFSVLVQVIGATGILTPITVVLEKVLDLIGLDGSLAKSVLNGFFETTLGAQTASLANASLGAKATITSLVIGWSGLSVHMQVASMLSGTVVRLKPFLYARMLHGLFAAIFTALLLGPASFVSTSISNALPVISSPYYLNGSFIARLLASARLATSLLLIVIIIISAIWLIKRMIYISLKPRA